MGVDLVSACIFCAGMLLGADLPVRSGLSGEMGFSYATLARRLPVIGDGTDTSDATPKFVLVGLGNARQPEEGLGSGTPAAEWGARVAFGTSHDEQFRGAYGSQVFATGTGRYLNFALLGRIPVGARDSVEFAINRRGETATDAVSFGPGNRPFLLSEERSLSASRADVTVGWRRSWRGLEAGAAFRWVQAAGRNATDRSSQKASGGMPGGEVEARWRSGPWTLVLHGELASGSLEVHRESFPAFADREASQSASFAAVRIGAGYVWPRTELFLTARYDRQKLPFVSLAVLGAETVAFDTGFDPSSVNEELFGDVTLRYRVTPAVSVRFSLAAASGDETVSLTDSAGAQPMRRLDVLRRGVFGGGLSRMLGSPELSLYLGADFSLGAPPP